jgi:ATP-binding protein involved in chromosome partitioning
MSFYSTIGRLVAVTSCKGGVGKSTVSLELAFSLAARGHRVGIFDADVYGPSLPSQLPGLLSEGEVALGNGGWSVIPLEQAGVKLMSFGWFARLWSRDVREGGELRDSFPGRLATKLCHTTAWGELDFLIIDSPPGTGGVAHAIAADVRPART